MPYCPNCRTEYRPGFSKCSDCGGPLAAGLSQIPEEGHQDEDKLVMVFDPPDPLICYSLSALLEDNGISCVVKSEEIPMFDGINGMISPRWGQLLVLERDKARAENLINEYLSAPLEEEPEKDK